MLKVDGVHTHIGQYHILQGIFFEAKEGEVSVLLGRNGIGKTTTLKTNSGPDTRFKGQIIQGSGYYKKPTPPLPILALAICLKTRAYLVH
jgi:branched-chain amino acid transport system ATP-binding protein